MPRYEPNRGAPPRAETPGAAAPTPDRHAHLRGMRYEEQRAAVQPRKARTDKPREPAQFEVLGERFASLQEVHDFLEATQPDVPEVVIRLTDGGPVQPTAQTLWHYYQPDQRIVLDGVGRRVDGTHNGRPTPGYFLSYRPAVGEDTSEDTPAAANLEVRNLTIRGFQSGGIEISPQRVAGEDNKWDGGEAAFVEGAHIHGVTFKDLGSKHSKKRDTDWSSMRFGAGGIMARGVRNSTFENNRFVGLENGVVPGAANDGKAGPRLIHAVYLNNASAGNTVRGNHFEDVSGDPVRVSNASHHNRVVGNTSENAGAKALVSDWYNTSDPKNPQERSEGTVMRGNRIGKGYKRRRKPKRFHRKESRGNRPELAV